MNARGWIAALSALALIGPPIYPWAIDPVGKTTAKHRHDRRHHKRRHRHRSASSRGRRAQQRASHHDFVLHVNHAQAPTAFHAAGDPPDTISDFKFSPATLTVNVGDTVTWTNNGPSPHTATASDGSFDTGTLQKGQSGSHTFSKSGSFAYICTIHPFMKGTIVVLGSSSGSSGSGSSTNGSSGSSGSTGSGSSSGSSGSGNTSSGSGSGGSLAFTGYDVALIVLLGAGMSAAGLLLRRRGGSETRCAVTKNTKSA